jgi:Hemopexin
VRYDLKKDTVELEHTRLPIQKEWHGLKTAENEDRDFTKNIDAAIQYGNGKVYFFKGDKYVRYDIMDNKLNAGPFLIKDKWLGLTEENSAFLNNLDAVVDDFDDTQLLMVPGAELDRMAPASERVPYLPSAWRGVLHITDGLGRSLEGAVAHLFQKRFWSHLTIDPRTGRIKQHFPLNVSARSMRSDPPNGIQTNRLHCIQIEILGLRRDWATMPAAQMDFIRNVMRSVEELVPIPRESGLIFLDNINRAPRFNQMQIDEWNRFSGWCGHQHVPLSNKPCPGALNINALLL